MLENKEEIVEEDVRGMLFSFECFGATKGYLFVLKAFRPVPTTGRLSLQFFAFLLL